MKGITLNSDAFGDPVTVKSGILELAGESTTGVFRRVFDVKPTQLLWGDTQLTLSGVIESDRKDVKLDMDISAGGAEWAQAEKILDYIQKSKTESDGATRKRNILGNLNVQIESFRYNGYSVQPLHTEIAFETDKVTITINRAAVCSITFQGLIKVTDQAMDIYMVPSTANQDLAATTACFTGEKNLTKGTYNLSGELLSKSKPDEFLRSMSGDVAFSSEEGRIYRFGLLAKILAILNFTEIYRGEVPDLTGEGFAYNSITINAEIKGGNLIMKECTLDGVSMGLACEGNIDLADKKMDLIVLVAPFKTVDRIVAVIPLIGHILGGKLISIPFQAKGDLKDPEVILLPPSAVGANVLGILERTLKLPITIIQPIISAEKNEKSEQKEGGPK